MNLPVILHIPHSSTHIPFYDGYVSSGLDLEQAILKLTDWYTDDLFQLDGAESVITPFSRIFCDVERFEADADEPMSRFGMGVLYEKMDAGNVMRVIAPELRTRIISEYYRAHHNALAALVEQHRAQYGRCLIVDCHSFPNTPLNASLNKEPDRPDYNIGTDPFHTPPHLVHLSQDYFDSLGYSLLVDKPYSGSMVPLKHYKQDKRVQSIMLEINRKLYLEAGTNTKSEGYEEVKKVVGGWLALLRDVR